MLKGGVMALATWWCGDSMPTLSLLPGFRVEASRDEHLIAQITRLARNEDRQRMHTDHLPDLAYVEQTAVGHGRMATQEASIGELGLRYNRRRSNVSGSFMHCKSLVDADTCWPALRPTTQPCTCAIERKPAKILAA